LYEAFDPDYLADCMHATENVIAQLQPHTKRSLFACKTRPQTRRGREKEGLKALVFKALDGGRDRD
jgi:hypothetical protein